MATFIVTVQYAKSNELGAKKLVSENYATDELTTISAQSKVVERIKSQIGGEFQVTSVRKANISEVFLSDSEDFKYYKVKLNFITINEVTAQEKRTASYFLVQATDLPGALAIIQKEMKSTISNYEIAQIIETPIIEYFK
jgi:hypothetical protein